MAVAVVAQREGDIRFGVLGPLQVMDGAGGVTVVPAAKQRIVLATLLLAGGTVVSAGELVETLWDAYPPPNAPTVMRTYVSRLRRALGPAGARVVGRPSGWAMELGGAEELDVAEVDALWRAGRAAAQAGEWRQVSSLLASALSLWRGEPLVDVPSAALARREAGRLAELRLQLTETRIDADLRLGRHGELIADLRRLAAEHPLREHLRVQLMLACYRCGQQAAALEVYRDARTTLAEELGVEPGYELQQMHKRILAADPDLAMAAAAPVRAMPAQRSGSSPGLNGDCGVPGAPAQPPGNQVDLAIRQAAGCDAEREPLPSVVPRQLPAAPADFAGRKRELRSLNGLLGTGADGGLGIVSISGAPGVGKTALAIQWAHHLQPRFPHGQLYVNLRGFDASPTPVTPAAAIGGFLQSLGVAPGQMPAGVDARAALYRSLLADNRMLILLDNARDEAQVRPLLPGSAACMVIVTSRNELPGLIATEGAYPFRLDDLTETEARQLLSARLSNDRIEAEADAVTELTALCGRLPLALVIAAARAAIRPGLPLASLTAELRDDLHRLDALNAGEKSADVRTVFSWSYRLLSEPAAGMFRLLGAHPGPDISLAAAASLAAISKPSAHAALSELTKASLLHEQSVGRFAFHALLRAYAADLGEKDERFWIEIHDGDGVDLFAGAEE